MNIDHVLDGKELFLIAGPCVIESEDICFTVAEKLKEISGKYNLPAIFKSSYAKANRLSGESFSGHGMDFGLEILGKVKEKFDLPVLTDVHETSEVVIAADVVDVLQIPAFLCRQTELVRQAAATGKWVNIKKGQFLAPEDMDKVAAKAKSGKVLLTERGSSFGYHNLVVDFRSLLILKRFGYPVVFDTTHSLQLPGGMGNFSSGQPEFIIPFAKAAVAIGVNGLFLEVHPEPAKALSDSATMLPLDRMETLVREVIKIREAVQK
ncbi:MAG TPA: 3-deoxy-8-phosphooctulonate synthase [candidate division Zixibacteria bacterium]|nr:3-deoxy-8-phosphooctulonate synthase [candidate division Zixibacteria bacterium]